MLEQRVSLIVLMRENKWFQINLHHQQTVNAKNDNKIVNLVAPERAENCTIVACTSALGNAVPPMILFKEQRLKSTFGNGLPPGSKIAMASNDSMTTTLFIEWRLGFTPLTRGSYLNMFMRQVFPPAEKKNQSQNSNDESDPDDTLSLAVLQKCLNQQSTPMTENTFSKTLVAPTKPAAKQVKRIKTLNHKAQEVT
ncbi:hypothetical protein ILUMI_07984 [Ignelater luminosus]|uniref:Uncharacterized protein n=1 Tax=Ignelater luminosus TaxID=2038154 RepID=A0A8K0D769_IGNLU|nr:hypothetical protein ILUMI_07984 [Ignelater luminosus]